MLIGYKEKSADVQTFYMLVTYLLFVFWSKVGYHYITYCLLMKQKGDTNILKGSDECWRNRKEWVDLTGLTITESHAEESPSPHSPSANQKIVSSNNTQTANNLNASQERLIEDGYVLHNNSPPLNSKDNDNETSSAQYKQLLQNLASAITKLHKTYSLPATFILLYDQAWELAASASDVLSTATHERNTFNFDVLAWYIDPRDETIAAGFSPHRDRQPKHAQALQDSFHPDGQAKYVTMWMALLDATPENSCLYVIPRHCDPGYLAGDDDGDQKDKLDDESPMTPSNDATLDPLARALSTKQAYQNIRALPRSQGDAVLFTHRIMHWGSKGNKNSSLPLKPRIAISFVCSDPSFERPYLLNWQKYWNPNATPKILPPFRIRLLLVCAQLLIYYQRFDLDKETIRKCYGYCKEYSFEFDPSYWKQVSLEFVKAMKEDVKNDDREAERANEDGGSDNDVSEDMMNIEKGDDDEDDALLEAMLENASHSDVSDDYDEMDDNGNDGCFRGVSGGEPSDDGSDLEDETSFTLFGKEVDSDTSNKRPRIK
jgi:hypothetical protein